MEFPSNGTAPHGTEIARVLIVGAPSAGKTTLAVPLAFFMCPDRKRIVPVDHAKPPKLSHLLGLQPQSPSTTDRNAQEDYFRKLLKSCQDAYPDGEKLMVMDESDMYFTNGGKSYGCQALKEIAHEGRGCFLAQIYISRSPLDLSRSQRGLFNLVLIGRNTEPRAAEWWDEYTGIEGFSNFLRDMPEEGHWFVAYATDKVPHVLGLWRANGGEIECRDWTPPSPPIEDENPENSTGGDEEATSPVGSASTPDASSSSPTGDGPGTVENTTPPTAGR